MSVVAIPELVRASIAGQTDRGKVREENRGMVHHASTKFGDLLVVADGAGDGAGGSQASRMAVDTISSGVAGMLAFFPPEIAVEEAVRQANTELTAASEEPEGIHDGMGVAVVVALLRMDTDRARVTIGHVGDSRAYLASKRKLTLLTSDDSPEPEMPAGKWTMPDSDEAHPVRSALTPCLGQGLNIKVSTSEMQLEAGDTLLLCSDGLWRSVSEPEIERVLADQTQSVEETCHALLDLARDAGSSDNVAIEIARLTQSGDSQAAAARAMQNQSGLLEKTTAAQKTPMIEWPVPESITYGTALSDAQLNATASLPGTFLYNPGPGAMLSTGEHTLSVVFAPSNQRDCAPAQATVPLRVGKATPAISWSAPDPINSATPLGSAQLNATASVPGRFAYSPAAGEVLGADAHTLLLNFTPADCVNFAPVEASVSLTVIESEPAAISWLNPQPISYGTALGDEQLSATSSVPGSFLYLPAPGNVLPPGKHELSVIFTPEDRVKFTETRATVTLIVEELPVVAPPARAASPTPLDSAAAAESAAEGIEELPILLAETREAGDVASELPIPARMQDDAGVARSEPETGEALQPEFTLFRSFQSDSEVEGGRKKTGRWSMIASVVIAIPMLCVLAFLIDKAHSGAPFIEKLVNQPAPAAGAAQPQSNTEDPAHRVKVTVDQASIGSGAQPASNSQPGSNQPGAKPTQTESTDDQSVAPTSQDSRKQAAQNAPPAAGTGRPGADEPSGRNGAINGDTQPTGREAASIPVYVSGDAAAGRLMESRTPIYPPAARASGISGTVKLEAIIAKDGTVKDLRAVSGPEQLRQAAVDCVRAWRYRPFVQNNEPAEVETTINVVFSPSE